ncbi:MAG: A/G-specific adenine glycosylase, partial [Bacteroidaceae bacterium]|nr:A/G-specific adenine glycosylase [Bacteroidaceae bacterium]
MSEFADKLISWYKENKRDLPWRDTRDPYRIWISEIILQQTRVAQGYDYFVRFMQRFPDVFTLAEAEEDEVMKYWQGLGYYSRARNLHAAAKQIAEWGAFPTDYKEVLSLKGVGEYTAAAICSFAYDMPCAVVDGNVYRVLSRWLGIDTPIDSTEGKKQFALVASELLDQQHPATYNQAIMDFGA